MQKGLEGRRIAVTTPDGEPSEALGVIQRELERAGAEVELLRGDGDSDAWHGGRYAALVVFGGAQADTLSSANPRLVQLVREFLVSEKPVAAYGEALGIVVEAGGAAGRTLTAEGKLKAATETAGGRVVDEPVHVDGCLVSAQARAGVEDFVRVTVRELSRQLEERDVDEMSAQSFPASDPPATSPASAGPAERPESRS